MFLNSSTKTSDEKEYSFLEGQEKNIFTHSTSSRIEFNICINASDRNPTCISFSLVEWSKPWYFKVRVMSCSFSVIGHLSFLVASH